MPTPDPNRRRNGLNALLLAAICLIGIPFIPAPARHVGPIHPTLIQHNGGFAYTITTADVGIAAPLPTTGIKLTEDGSPLRIDHMHADIRAAGAGRWSPWGDSVYFSATDNSDTRTNGRSYVLIMRGTLLARILSDAAWSPYVAIVLLALGAYLFCIGLPRTAPGLSRRLSAGIIRYSPFDLRCILRIALLFVAWRQACADYWAIPTLIDGIQLHALSPKALDTLAVTLQNALLDTPAKLAGVQVASVVLLLGTAVHLRRWTLLLALAPTLIIEWSAYHYRGQLPDVDPLLAVLVMAALWPHSWRAVTQKGKQITTPATAMGLTLAAYIAAVYFVTGWSKVSVDGPWWKTVRFDLLYAAMIVWMGSSPPDWLDGIAKSVQQLFDRVKWLGELSALTTLILELTWPLVLVFRPARWIIPVMMLAAHAVIFISSGILFLPMALIGISVVIPWRQLKRATSGKRAENANESAALCPWMVLPMAVAASLAVIPGMHSVDAFPFSNYKHFNWTHETLLKPTTAYRLGYRDRTTGRVVPIPPNHGGFLDIWSVRLASGEVDRYINESDEKVRADAHARLLQYARALRPHRSSQRLGVFSCPPHVLGQSDPIPVEWFDELHLLRGTFDAPSTGVQVEWQDLGPLLDWPE